MSNSAATFLIWWAQYQQGATDTTRVTDLTLKTNTSFFEWYGEFSAALYWFKNEKNSFLPFTPRVYLMLTLLSCSIWKYAGFNLTGTCYDNVFADMVLNGGDKPDGIYGYIDVFTW